MELSVIPCLATDRGATLWFGVTATRPPGALRLRVSGESHDLPAQRWIPLGVEALALDSRASPAPFWYFRHHIEALASDTVYRVHVEFAESDGRSAQAQFRTLPARLPVTGIGAPLRVDLRSCFYLKTGRATASQPRAETSEPPHLTVMCGDQVYLDLPVLELPRRQDPRFLRWLDKYREHWSTLGGSFAAVLRHGANLFVADDHEFWNNYPYGAIYKPDTWGSSTQDASSAIARALFQAFQTDYEASQSGVQRLDIGPQGRPELSLRALDCRYFRTRERFAPEADLQAICAWLAGLTCPGVLVLSQPLLEPSANWFTRRIKDANLADYPASYEPLLRAIRAVRHDLMILSGDIHCGRVSSVALGAGRTLWEVVSSPVALCAGGYHKNKPIARLPGLDRQGGAGTILTNLVPDRVERDHHALLDFSRKGASVVVKIRFEGLGDAARAAPPMPTVQDIVMT